MDPGKQSQDLLALSASMRTALLVYSGITVKMMVDSDLGAQLATMFMVQYEPDGVAGAQVVSVLEYGQRSLEQGGAVVPIPAFKVQPLAA